MYYNRLPGLDLLALLQPGGALEWLVDHVHGTWGATHGAHLQLRRSEGARGLGSVQVYLGRTSPLEVIARPGDRYRLRAHRTYAVLAPDLFDHAVDVAALAALRPRLVSHLDGAVRAAPAAFLEGEARVGVGMLRRYGPHGRHGDPFVALDSEAVVGFADEAEQAAYGARLRTALGAFGGVSHDKLDVLGVLADGSIGLVEIKAADGDLGTAAAQVASHVHRFRALGREDPGWETGAIRRFAVAKRAARLLPYAPRIATPTPIVPVIAAPDARGDWVARWRKALGPALARCPELLAGLRVWRLSPAGEILEEERLA